MGTPFIGEIRITPYTFPPQGWLYCDGSLQQISDYGLLFQLIGTTYGGDGISTFGLPDLRSRVPIHQGTSSGTNYPFATAGGVETVTLNSQTMPTHYHSFTASSNDPNQNGPGNGYASTATNTPYTSDASSLVGMGTSPVSVTGGSQPHNNIMPFVGIAFVIATYGMFPSQN